MVMNKSIGGNDVGVLANVLIECVAGKGSSGDLGVFHSWCKGTAELSVPREGGELSHEGQPGNTT